MHFHYEKEPPEVHLGGLGLQMLRRRKYCQVSIFLILFITTLPPYSQETNIPLCKAATWTVPMTRTDSPPNSKARRSALLPMHTTKASRPCPRLGLPPAPKPRRPLQKPVSLLKPHLVLPNQQNRAGSRIPQSRPRGLQLERLLGAGWLCLG